MRRWIARELARFIVSTAVGMFVTLAGTMLYLLVVQDLLTTPFRDQIIRFAVAHFLTTLLCYITLIRMFDP